MFGVFDSDWRYSHADVDVGTKIVEYKGSQVLDLILKSARVTRKIELLWKRHTFRTRQYREKWGNQFQFTIEFNQVEGLFHKNLRGYVLWRDWYECIQSPRGGVHLSRVNREIVAVVFNEHPVYRVDGSTITEKLKMAYPAAFNNELTPLEDLLV